MRYRNLNLRCWLRHGHHELFGCWCSAPLLDFALLPWKKSKLYKKPLKIHCKSLRHSLNLHGNSRGTLHSKLWVNCFFFPHRIDLYCSCSNTYNITGVTKEAEPRYLQAVNKTLPRAARWWKWNPMCSWGYFLILFGSWRKPACLPPLCCSLVVSQAQVCRLLTHLFLGN